MNVDAFLFAFVAGAGILTAMFALISREIVHTIMWIAAFFVTLALTYFLLEAPFLGVLQLAVYAGAVTILLLFAVMVVRKRIFSRESETGFGAAAIGLTFLLAFLMTDLASRYTPGGSAQTFTALQLSENLFTLNGAWILALGLVMLSALVGSIYLAKESRGKPIRAEGL